MYRQGLQASSTGPLLDILIVRISPNQTNLTTTK